MQGINRISGMGSMPVNCGMKGMHENQIKTQQDNNISKSIQVSSVPNTVGSKIDVSA
ncbi:hypothetical protein [Clostridium magnum]|uniref:Uncharacterized protein n=1 Tax=Clostridium magnum DSM 2767 TaxID=1121326 RepID=A0A161X0E9_9CLOT|nr:hypothetical protein [Clostridium magnum]KZL92898.1 hypothetical protein CLMAG_27120 [Clostridium magnum DSM 2767]SHI28047.1 hypothetical protein SAMN02745944_03934 [Clostridium magnum DSM 2767]